MISVAGQPYDISGIIGEYPARSIERQLLNTMSNSSGTYQYDNLDQLRFEVRLRKEIVNASVELNRSYFSFAVFRNSRANPEYWDRTTNGGFRLKRGAKPSEAIRDILVNGAEYATECATAMMIVYYIALLNVYSEDLFNRVFPQIYLMNWHSLDPLLREAGLPVEVTDILIGDRGYFNNPDVSPETPELQGENVIVLPNELYYGHGIGITTADAIIQILNNNRKEGATRSAYFMNTAARPDFKRLADVYLNRTQAA